MSEKILAAAVRCLSNGQENEEPRTVVRHKSETIPIHADSVGGKLRCTIAFYPDGRRWRRIFNDLARAKHEAKLAAEKIQRGLVVNNDSAPVQAGQLVEPGAFWHRVITGVMLERVVSKFILPFPLLFF